MSDHRNQFDALVIGAGPAGAASAAVLAEYGHRVVVLEREKFPRYHIGESLIPFTFHPLERLGLIPAMKSSAFVRKYSIQFAAPSGKFRSRFISLIATTAKPSRRRGRCCAPSSTKFFSTTPAPRALKFARKRA